MASPSESRSSRSPGPAAVPARQPSAGARDRLLATLVSLAGDLTVEREEPGLLRSSWPAASRSSWTTTASRSRLPSTT